MTTVARLGGDEKVELALTVLALAGDNSAKACKMLRSQDVGISARSLRRWRGLYADRYEAICRTRAREIEQGIITTTRALAIRYAELEQQAIEATSEQLTAGEHKDPSTAMRNAAVAKGINVDKMLVLDGRPNEIVEHRSSEQVLRGLFEKGYIDASADEVDVPELPPAA